MKTKEDAAKILLDTGWTLEEINNVIGEEKIIIQKEIHSPYAMPMITQPIVIQPEPLPKTKPPFEVTFDDGTGGILPKPTYKVTC